MRVKQFFSSSISMVSILSLLGLTNKLRTNAPVWVAPLGAAYDRDVKLVVSFTLYAQMHARMRGEHD